MCFKKRQVAVLGSTGSIGTQTLAVLEAFPNMFSVAAISGYHNLEKLKEQMLAHNPKWLCVGRSQDQDVLQAVAKQYDLQTTVVYGQNGLVEICQDDSLDMVVIAIVGTASLRPTVEAIETGTSVALACKEVLVAAGEIIMPMAKKKGVPILPIDSEHAALKQCLAGVNEEAKCVDKLILTASGGPFWQREKTAFDTITKEMALKHPSWKMGDKITIDSATMMNKGLEVIEAHHLFGIPYDQIEVVIHPHSIVHSIVEFSDHTMLAQMGVPDMRLPIQYALTYPEKHPNLWKKTSLTELPPLTFHPPDFDKFPLLRLAFEEGKKGGVYPMILNAANEVAVHQFLTDQLSFNQIPDKVESIIRDSEVKTVTSIQDIVELDLQIKTDGGLLYE